MSTVEEELSECEVLWPETRHGAPGSAWGSSTAAPMASRDHRQCSAPVDIPRAAHLPRGRAGLDGDEEEDGAMVPPHLMVSRRWSEGKAAAAFSLRSGPGRAHRDLNHLRNSVLRMTGFIEG
ncbi:hypothetical protein ACQJBY_027895 [Aegilops geniculata]